MNDLKARRTEAGLTQAELARRVGCSTQHLGNIENGRFKASPGLMSAIERALGGKVVRNSSFRRGSGIPNVSFEDAEQKAFFRELWAERQGGRKEVEANHG